MKSWSKFAGAVEARLQKALQETLNWPWLADVTAVLLLFFTMGAFAVIYENLGWYRSLREPFPPANSQYPPLDLGPLAMTLFAALVPLLVYVLSIQRLRTRSARIPFGIGCIPLLLAYILIFLKLGFVAPLTTLDVALHGLVVWVVLTAIWGAVQIVRASRKPARLKGVAA
jgi:hypothetical protein